MNYPPPSGAVPVFSVLQASVQQCHCSIAGLKIAISEDKKICEAPEALRKPEWLPLM